MNAASRTGTYLGPRLGVIVSGWPRVSETFALNELLALRRGGLLGAVFATKPGDCGLRQPESETLDDLVEVLPNTSIPQQGAYVAARMIELDLQAIHGYFAHPPAEVASIAAQLSGRPYGFSCHALDVRKVPAATLARRGAGAAVVVACNRDVAVTLDQAGVQPCLLAHGVDLRRFQVPASTGASPGRQTGTPMEVLAVGRLVAKKGFAHLVEAFTRCRRDIRLSIVGEGPERDRLERLITDLALADRVRLLGGRTHHQLPGLYRQADVVAVPSVVDVNGDRDGLPNVVLEAMACARPVLASDVAAIATAVETGHSGVLVPPGDVGALAAALDKLAASPTERARLGANARHAVEQRFDLDHCGQSLCRLLEKSYG